MKIILEIGSCRDVPWRVSTFVLLTYNQLQRAPAPLFHEYLFPLDEFFFDAVFVVADCK